MAGGVDGWANNALINQQCSVVTYGTLTRLWSIKDDAKQTLSLTHKHVKRSRLHIWRKFCIVLLFSLGEHCLDPDTHLLDLYNSNPGGEWVIRLKPNGSRAVWSLDINRSDIGASLLMDLSPFKHRRGTRGRQMEAATDTESSRSRAQRLSTITFFSSSTCLCSCSPRSCVTETLRAKYCWHESLLPTVNLLQRNERRKCGSHHRADGAVEHLWQNDGR